MEELSRLPAGTHSFTFALGLFPALGIWPYSFLFSLALLTALSPLDFPHDSHTCLDIINLKKNLFYTNTCFSLPHWPPVTSHFSAIFHNQTPQNYLCSLSLVFYLLFSIYFFGVLFLTSPPSWKTPPVFIKVSRNQWSFRILILPNHSATFNPVGYFFFIPTFSWVFLIAWKLSPWVPFLNISFPFIHQTWPPDTSSFHSHLATFWLFLLPHWLLLCFICWLFLLCWVSKFWHTLAPILSLLLFPIYTFFQSYLVQFCDHEYYLHITNSKICTCTIVFPLRFRPIHPVTSSASQI